MCVCVYGFCFSMKIFETNQTTYHHHIRGIFSDQKNDPFFVFLCFSMSVMNKNDSENHDEKIEMRKKYES